MEIMLINSPLFRNNKNLLEEDILPPIGLGYIASNLRMQNIDVKLIDGIIRNTSFSKLKSIIDFEKPKFIGVNIFSTNYKLVKELIETIDFKTHIIIGGLSTQSLYSKIIYWNTNNQLDVVIGDGELIIVDIIRNNIKEKTFFENQNRRVFNIDCNSVYFVKDISSIPLNREFFNEKPIKNYAGLLEMNLVTSRGCIYNCSFCSAARSINKDYPVRERSANSIIEELSEIRKKYPETDSIRILDDLFLKSKDSIIKATEIFSSLNFKWRSMAHIQTFNDISQDVLVNLKKSGCSELFIGIESGSSIILKSLNKTNNIDLILNNLEKIFKAGINVKGYFICGLPDETLNDLEMTYNLACTLKNISLKYNSNFRTSVFQFRPYHGTLLYKSLKEKFPELDIDNITPNNKLSNLTGKRQFNFQSINYSKVSKKLIHDYICKTNMV